MNERIRELWRDCVLKHTKDPMNWQTVADEFAELIVRECMNQVRDQYLPVLEDRVMMTDTHWAGYVQCGVDSYVAIREHFGVERDER